MDTHTKFIRASSRLARRAILVVGLLGELGSLAHIFCLRDDCLNNPADARFQDCFDLDSATHSHPRATSRASSGSPCARRRDVARARRFRRRHERIARLAALACALPRRGDRFARGRSELMTTTDRRRCRRPTCSGAARRVVHPPLHRAARWGDRARVLALLSEADAPDVDTPDRNGSTAMMWAAQFGHDDVVDALLRNGASPSRATASDGPPSSMPRLPTSPATSSPSFSPPRASPAARASSSLPACSPARTARSCANTPPTRDDPAPLDRWRASRLASSTRRGDTPRAPRRALGDILENPAEMVVGGVAVAGCTFKPLGLSASASVFARLFWRPAARRRHPRGGGCRAHPRANRPRPRTRRTRDRTRHLRDVRGAS